MGIVRRGSPQRASLWLLLLPFLLTGTTTPGPGSVGGSVTAKCTAGTGSMAFGNYDPLVTNKTAALNVTGSVVLSCTRGAPSVTVTLDNGQNSTHASGTTRAMVSGATYLSYELYTSAAHSTVWNSTNSVGYASTSMASGSLPVYGQIPGAQNVPAAASYSDSVTVTVNF